MHAETTIYLASASPRRRELLQQIGMRIEVLPSNLLEARLPGEAPDAYVQRVAADKAHFVARLVMARGLPPRPVLGADTEVVLEGEVLGKPNDRAHTFDMLRRLSGRTHEVLTGLALVHGDDEYTSLSRSRVTFAELSDDEIDGYWATSEPADKAGGYAIQGRGALFISRIEGSYSGIVGLPLHELGQMLAQAGMRVA